MNKTTRFLGLPFLVIVVFIGGKTVSANDIINLVVPISPTGDVPAITVPCTVGHAYTEGLYNNSVTYILGNYSGISGGITRKYCETGSITFSGWNMNTVLDSYNGVDNWTYYIRPPFKYVIIDSTLEGGCASVDSCAQYNLMGDWENYNNAIYLPSNHCYITHYGEACALAAGPIWSTVPYTRTWFDPRDVIPTPPPVGDPNNLPAIITPHGDIPSISISCIPGHDYTLSLVHSVDDVVEHNYGVVQRIWCWPGVHNNVIAFDGFNLTDFLRVHVDAEWWRYTLAPLQYIIKDTTGIYACDDEYCPLVNLVGPFNNYDKSAYIASSTEFMTVGKGPVFDTTDHVTWFNTNIVTPPETGFSNVLFIPGLEASRLYVDKTVLGLPVEDQLWEPNGNSDAINLYLNTDGTSKDLGIYTGDVIKETNTPISTGFAGQNIYKSFSNMLDGLVSSGDINAWQSYAYDWRQSVQDIVDTGTQYKIGNTLQKISLTNTLQGLVDSSKNGKVTIIAHSNGGLITKAFLKKLEEDKIAGRNTLIDHVDVVILVASPQWGTPTAIPALLHGYDQDIGLGALLTNSVARELGRNMPSAYGLLPSAEYFNHVSTPVVNFVPNPLDPWMSKEVANYGQGVTNFTEESGFISGLEVRNEPIFFTDTRVPIKGNSLLLDQANTLHQSIDTMTLPANIRLVQIAGWGLDTVAGFQYNTSTTCSYSTDAGCTGKYILDEKPIFTVDGDKTVVSPSALAMEGENYWVNLFLYNRGFTLDREHKNIIEVNQLNNFISSLVKKEDYIFDSVLSNTKPIDTSNRLRLSVHSPVTLDGYDAVGNHTGKMCPTLDTCYIEENIPNSAYYEFGEGKYLNIPQDSLQKVTLQGTGVGTFTFDYQTVTPSGQTATQSFVDIPVTTQTQAIITTNQITQVPQLTLDVTGDGVTDFTVKPSTTFDPITYLQIMKVTIDSLDITKAKKKDFDNRVDTIIRLIQKGKIDNAKLKVDQFVSILRSKSFKSDSKEHRQKKLSKTDAQILLDLLNGLLDNLV